ncbi:hypothetical protein Natoc_4152 (plasmid) [Natronococcus occultus SP4]|uniref:Uncharacterized protein n=1 Tax=Natronococcus occultus SP4 TaxID=694430 RepID=L0K6W7_9EURY|nr:hypothetical protein Natoc_4152 [Natronococcus occultus SP4]
MLYLKVSERTTFIAGFDERLNPDQNECIEQLFIGADVEPPEEAVGEDPDDEIEDDEIDLEEPVDDAEDDDPEHDSGVNGEDDETPDEPGLTMIPPSKSF